MWVTFDCCNQRKVFSKRLLSICAFFSLLIYCYHLLPLVLFSILVTTHSFRLFLAFLWIQCHSHSFRLCLAFLWIQCAFLESGKTPPSPDPNISSIKHRSIYASYIFCSLDRFLIPWLNHTGGLMSLEVDSLWCWYHKCNTDRQEHAGKLPDSCLHRWLSSSVPEDSLQTYMSPP